MNISKIDLDRAAVDTGLSSAQGDALWLALTTRAPTLSPPPPPAGAPPASRFDVAHLAYYFGAMIVLGAMSWFMTLAWEGLGGPGIFAFAVAYATLFAMVGRRLWGREETRTPGGLLWTLAVGMTPLAIYGLERTLGWWPRGDPGAYAGFHVWVRAGWILMEVGTVLVGVLVLRRVPFPFLTAPMAYALWYLSMDLAPLLFGQTEFDWHQRLWVSVWFGLAMLLLAYLVDLRRRPAGGDFAFWFYLFGILTFWFGLSLLKWESEGERLLYTLINVGLMFAAVLLDRRVFLVFGAMGVMAYLGRLAHEVFKDSLLFPLVLTGFGLGVIAAGVFYQRKREALRQAILALVPDGMRRWLPRAQAAG